MKILNYAISEVGGRKVNEDSIQCGYSADYGRIFVLADGLGGHGLGDAASQEACRTVFDYYQYNPEFYKGMFTGVYSACQRNLNNRQIAEHAEGKMRTTMNLVCVDNNYVYWSHIGDSRTYYFQNGELVKRTIDHSVPQMLANLGEIKEEDIRHHEDRNRVLKVLGVEDQEPAFDEEEPVAISGTQQFLMCSDGFWELITEAEMLACLSAAKDPKTWIDSMLEIVHRNAPANADNTSVVAVWIEGDRNE